MQLVVLMIMMHCPHTTKILLEEARTGQVGVMREVSASNFGTVNLIHIYSWVNVLKTRFCWRWPEKMEVVEDRKNGGGWRKSQSSDFLPFKNQNRGFSMSFPMSFSGKGLYKLSGRERSDVYIFCHISSN